MRFASISLGIALLWAAGASGVQAQTAITIESVTNLTDDSTLPGGLDNAFVFQYNLTGAPAGNYYWPANGWIIYSPDGADWGFVQGEALPAFTSFNWPYLFVNHFNKIGGTGTFGLPLSSGGGNITGHDTVGVVLAALFAEPGYGLPSGFNNPAFQVRFSTRRSDADLHICIDTSSAIPGASWEWANADGLIVPDWSDSRCYVIGCCAGRVGDVNGEGGDEPTVSDVAALIDHLFISQAPLDCLEEADVNLSGTLVNPPLDPSDISIGDISTLIDYLFISTEPMLPGCP
jgi:hypothetical protein